MENILLGGMKMGKYAQEGRETGSYQEEGMGREEKPGSPEHGS